MELNSETDFASRSPDFVSACRELVIQYLHFVHRHHRENEKSHTSRLITTPDDPERVLNSVPMSNGRTAREWINNLISMLKENVILRRVHHFHYRDDDETVDVEGAHHRHDHNTRELWSVPLLGLYTHQVAHTSTITSSPPSQHITSTTASNSTSHNKNINVNVNNNNNEEEVMVTVGQGSVLVALRVCCSERRESSARSSAAVGTSQEFSVLWQAFRTFSRTLALHIFARDPRFIRPHQPPPTLSHLSHPPPPPPPPATSVDESDEEQTLLLQRWMADESLSVQDALRGFEQEWGVNVHIDDWVRYRVGEGLQRPAAHTFT